jgi:hypothetical protein
MSYHTNIFDLPDLKIDLPNNLPPAFQNKNDCVVIGERKFHLNKSRTKFLSIGLAHDFNYEPFVKLSGNKCDVILFNREEWKYFLTYQGIVTNYFCSNDLMDSIETENFRVDFEQVQNSRVVKISKNNSYIYLGYETICNLWERTPLIEYRLDILERLQFTNYFKIVQKGLQTYAGNIFDNALNLLQPSKNRNSENVSMIMELIYLYPKIFEAECGRNEKSYV